MNIQLDPDEKIGFTEMRADWDTINANGTGSYVQAIPNAERFQQVTQDFIGEFNLIQINLKVLIIDKQQII